jgi:hypothetical protein
MAPAKLTPAQIRDRKAKRVAVVLVVVLVAALAIQGPKILKLINGSSPQADVPAVAVAAAVAPGSAGAGALTATTTVSGYVTHFSHFSVKDPFYAQNVTTTTATTTAAPAAASATTTTTGKPAASKPPKAATQTPGSTTTTATTTTTALPFTVTTPAVLPNAAVLLANGKREVVQVGADFPSDTPLFKLNALGHKGKHGKPASSVRISVVGGSFADGVATIPLLLGKPLTFANQSDGSRYVIKLLRFTTVDTSQAVGAGGTTTAAAPATTSPTSGG